MAMRFFCSPAPVPAYAPLDAAQSEIFGKYGGTFVEVAGIRTHYFEYGDLASKDVVLFVHGYGGTGMEAASIAPYLSAAGYRIISPDWPGAGLSQSPDDYSMQFLMDWLEGFRAVMGLERFFLAGHSFGGYLSTKYSVNHPQRVERLILIDPAGFREELGSFFLGVAQSDFLVNLGAALYTPWVHSLINAMNTFKDPARAPKDIMEYASVCMGTSEGRKGLIAISRRIVAEAPDLDCLDSLTVPTLLFWAVQDRVLPYEWKDAFLESIPAETLFHSVNDCGHAPHMEKPEETAQAIISFLKS